MTTSPLLHFAIVAAFALSSCDKAERLRADQASLQTKREEVLRKMKELDEKLRSLGVNGMGSVEPMENKAAAMTKEAATMETEATIEARKWAALDKSLIELQARADAWKAANLR